MDFNNPSVRRGLLAAAGVVLVIALIGVFVVNSDDSGGKKNVAANQQTTSTTASLSPVETGAPTSVTTPGATVTTAKAGGPATTAAAGKATTTVPAAQVPNPGVAKPPAVGTYTYAQVTTGTDGKPANSTTTTKVAADPNQGSAIGRSVSYVDGQGNSLTNHELWTAASVTIPMTHIGAAQGSLDCTWKPAILEFKLPLAMGTAWSFDSTCVASVQGTQVTVHQTGALKVISKALDKIGSVSVPTWVLSVSGTTTVTSAFLNQKLDTTATRHFSPERGILTYDSATTTANGNSSKTERTLQNVTPTP